MTTTTNDLIEATRGHLQGTGSEELNRLDGNLDATQTSITFKYDLKGIVPRTIIAVGLEEIRVWETDNAKIATVVERHVNGSAAAAHTDLDDVYVKPLFSPFRILRAINNDLDDLCTPAMGLYQVKIVPQFTFRSGVYAYDLAGVTGEDDVLAVDYQMPGSSGVWNRLGDDDFDVARDQNTTSFPSGFSITFPFGGSSGVAYRIAYRAPFTPLSTTSLTADVTTSGMTAEAAKKLLPLGAAIELMSGREVKRNFTEAQGDTRRATEVPPGAVLGSVNGLIRLRAQRVAAEASRLAARYPVFLRSPR